MSQSISAALSLVNSGPLPHGFRAALSNHDMRVVEEVRRIRLQMLIDQRFGGSQARLREAIELSKTDSTISQLLNQATGSRTSKPKNMGSAMARKIEAKCGLEEGWMDTDPDLAWPFGARVDAARLAALDAEWIAEAAGAVNEVLRRAEGQSRKPQAAA